VQDGERRYVADPLRYSSIEDELMSVLREPMTRGFPDLVPDPSKFEFHMIPLISDAILSE